MASKIITRKVVTDRHKMNLMIESYNSAMEVAEDCKKRSITNSHFDDKSTESFGSWEGVKTYDEALGYMKNGFQPTVEKLKEKVNPTRMGTGKRITFKNNIVGSAPVVPLAIMGVPNCMIDMKMKPIKCKVIDVYYDITCSSGTSSDKIIKNGQKLLGTILELEAKGYKFNLYAMQTYSDEGSADILTVKLKSSNQPLDLKRISFPLTHTAFFRVIGFDWYSRTPKGKYRAGYGMGLSYVLNKKEVDEMMSQAFGRNSMYIAGKEIMDKDEEYIRKVLLSGEDKHNQKRT